MTNPKPLSSPTSSGSIGSEGGRKWRKLGRKQSSDSLGLRKGREGSEVTVGLERMSGGIRSEKVWER